MAKKIKDKTVKVKRPSKSTQPAKSKFRSTVEWKDFRSQILLERNGLCELCGIDHSKNTRKLELHHKDLNPNNYTDISDPTHFALLCGVCHKSVHQFHTRIISKKQPSKNTLLLAIDKLFFL